MTTIATLWECPSEQAVLSALGAFLADFATSGYSSHVPPECMRAEVPPPNQLEDWTRQVRLAVEHLDPRGNSDGDRLELDTMHHLREVVEAAARRIDWIKHTRPG